MIFLKIKDEKVQAIEAWAGLRSFQATITVLFLLLALVAITDSDVISDPLVLLIIPIVIGTWTNILILNGEGIHKRYQAEFRKDPAFRRKGILVHLGVSVFFAAIWLAALRLQIIGVGSRAWGRDIIPAVIIGVVWFFAVYFSMFRQKKQTS